MTADNDQRRQDLRYITSSVTVKVHSLAVSPGKCANMAMHPWPWRRSKLEMLAVAHPCSITHGINFIGHLYALLESRYYYGRVVVCGFLDIPEGSKLCQCTIAIF